MRKTGPFVAGNRISRAITLGLLAGFISAPVNAAPRPDELVMFRDVGCPFCAQWDHDVGKLYAKTDEAKLLPLRQVDLLGTRPSDLTKVAGVQYTPTFVLMHCGREIARITGYLGPDQFWGLLDKDIATLKQARSCVS